MHLNASTDLLDQLNDLAHQDLSQRFDAGDGQDVAHVSDKYIPQTNLVHVDGKKGVLEPIYKLGNASTLSIVKRVKDILPTILPRVPENKQLKVTPLFDQSIFVRAAVMGVVKEAGLAAALTGIMILVFLGSWRSTLIICISIPLSILVSIIILWALGQTLNVMTLGGMALAVGILVDDATVEIENIHRNLHQRKRLVKAILDGASQIAVPAFVSTLCICIVFVPVWFITGAARSLFTPLAEGVIFAMLTSYLLSRTLMPTMVHFLLESEVEMYGGVEQEGIAHVHSKKPKKNWIWRIHEAFNVQFEKFRKVYGGFLAFALHHRISVLAVFAGFVLVSCALYPFVGRDFFPAVDAGQIRLHVRGFPGTRLEESERNFARVEAFLRTQIPPEQVDTIIDNIGIPNSGINMSLSDGSGISAADGEILISLKENHEPTADIVKKLRKALPAQFPEMGFWFQAADIATQVLNFGLPAPIDVQVVGPKTSQAANLEVAERLRKAISGIPGAVDVHIHQVTNVPDLRINVDRVRADQMGMTQQAVANALLVSLSSSGIIAPAFWLNPKNGVQYPVAVQTPQYKIDSINALNNTPITSPSGITELMGNVASIDRGYSSSNITHYNIKPTFDIQANVQDTDLG